MPISDWAVWTIFPCSVGTTPQKRLPSLERTPPAVPAMFYSSSLDSVLIFSQERKILKHIEAECRPEEPKGLLSLLSCAMSWKIPMTGETSRRMKPIFVMKNGAFKPQGSLCLKSGLFKHAQKKSSKTFNSSPIPLKNLPKNQQILPEFPWAASRFTHSFSNGKVF